MIIAGPLNLGFIRGCTFEATELQMQNAAGDPVDITGFNVAAEVRVASATTVIIDLSPSITDAPNGVVTIPGINDETTKTYTADAYQWDLLLEDGSDNRQKMLAGRFDITEKITDST